MRKAMRNLSRTEIGQFLLERAGALGYKVIYDKKTAEKDEALGMCYRKPRKITVAPGLPINELSILLAHELAHAVFFHDLETPDIPVHPNFILMRDHAMEADARAHEALFVMEFAFSARNRQQRNAILNHFMNEEPVMARAVIKTLLSHEVFDEEAAKDIMRTAFECYYRNYSQRRFYEKSTLEENDFSSEKKSLSKNGGLARAFNKAATEMGAAFLYKGRPYLSGNANREPLDFKDPEYMGLSVKGLKAIEKQREAIKNPSSLSLYWQNKKEKEKEITGQMRRQLDEMIAAHRALQKAGKNSQIAPIPLYH